MPSPAQEPSAAARSTASRPKRRTRVDPMSFYSLDLEYANPKLGSICQIGLVRVRKGRIAARWSSLVNPRTSFQSRRTKVHGIDRKAVRDQPTIGRFHNRLLTLEHSVVVHHGGKDPAALAAALNRAGLTKLQGVRWLDSVEVCRRAWPHQFALSGYGLKNVATTLGVSFRHHDAAEDAEAAAEVVLRACRVRGVDVHRWLALVECPADFGGNPPLRDRTPRGLLNGDRIAFTGSLRLIPRHKTLADLLGCEITPGFDARTTILVVGEADPSGPGGDGKAAKLLAGEELAAAGAGIRILSEQAFVSMVEGRARAHSESDCDPVNDLHRRPVPRPSSRLAVDARAPARSGIRHFAL